jgi:hypothetical protein
MESINAAKQRHQFNSAFRLRSTSSIAIDQALPSNAIDQARPFPFDQRQVQFIRLRAAPLIIEAHF